MYRISAPSNWAISFHRSALPSGAPVYYFVWSGVEHFFVDEDVNVERELAILDAQDTEANPAIQGLTRSRKAPPRSRKAPRFWRGFARGTGGRRGNPRMTANDAEVLVDELMAKGNVRVPSEWRKEVMPIMAPVAGELTMGTPYEDQWGDEVLRVTAWGHIDKAVIRELEHRQVDVGYEPLFLAVVYVYREGDDPHQTNTDGFIVNAPTFEDAREIAFTAIEEGEPVAWPSAAWLETHYPGIDLGSIDREGLVFFMGAQSAEAQDGIRARHDELVLDGMDSDEAAEQAQDEYWTFQTILSVTVSWMALFRTEDEARKFIHDAGRRSLTPVPVLEAKWEWEQVSRAETPTRNPTSSHSLKQRLMR
jgi:hypothetical protein